MYLSTADLFLPIPLCYRWWLSNKFLWINTRTPFCVLQVSFKGDGLRFAILQKLLLYRKNCPALLLEARLFQYPMNSLQRHFIWFWSRWVLHHHARQHLLICDRLSLRQAWKDNSDRKAPCIVVGRLEDTILITIGEWAGYSYASGSFIYLFMQVHLEAWNRWHY